MDSTKEHIEEQRILSFCYGYGGLERGISQCIPTRTVAYVEIEAFQDFNLVAAMESGLVDPAPIWTDLKTFDAKPFRNRIHGIVGGYPCQGESHAGQRKLWNDPRFLWPYIEKAIIASNPVWCFFENVSGHLTGSFPYVLESLRSMGYAVEAGLFTADEVGAPHERKRIFIFAMENSELAKWRDTGICWKEKERSQPTNKPTDASGKDELVNADNPRDRTSQHGTNGKRTEKSKEHETGFLVQNGDKWPAGKGEFQYEWEEPRTIKPGVGCTVNGYNFRTELLRQFGNGVVHQQSAIAFRTLVSKLLTENKII